MLKANPRALAYQRQIHQLLDWRDDTVRNTHPLTGAPIGDQASAVVPVPPIPPVLS